MKIDYNKLKLFGQRLEQLRTERNVNPITLAESIDISIQDYFRIEAGAVDIDVITMLSIAKALNVTPAELMDF